MPASRARNSETFKVSSPSDREIRMTRLFDAPVDLVFEAMSKPEHIRRWWGALGEGYSVPVCEVDVRVGGKWRFVNRTPTGEMVEFYGEYREIVPNERIVSTEVYEGFPQPNPDVEEGSVNTVTLTEVDGRTILRTLVQHSCQEHRDAHINSGMEGGMQTTFDALEEVAISLA